MKKKFLTFILMMALATGLITVAPASSVKASDKDYFEKEIAVAIDGSVSYKFSDTESLTFTYDKTADIGDQTRGSTKYEIRRSGDTFVLTLSGVKKGVSVARIVQKKKDKSEQSILLFMQVTAPTVKDIDPVMTIGEKYKPKVSGTCECSTIYVSTTNSNVVGISTKENGKTEFVPKAVGTVQLSVTVDGLKFTQTVVCEDDLSVNETAVREAAAVLGATYSQPKRMEAGYYDCSSLVWRSYKKAGYKLTSGDTAPVAADLAKKLEKSGRVIAYGHVKSSELKPGDLIFYTSGESNGRYKNISHVAMYYGEYTDPISGKKSDKIIHAYKRVELGDYNVFGVSRTVLIIRP